MTVLESVDPEIGDGPSGSGPRLAVQLVVGAVIAAAIAITVVVWVDARGEGDQEVAISLIGADDDAEAREAFAVVESAFAAYNSGDMGTWARLREGSASLASDFALDSATGGRFEVDQCTYRGLREWEFDGPTFGHGFDCAVARTDRLWQAAGIELEMTYSWIVGDDLESARAGSNEDFEFIAVFEREFLGWLVATYPDVDVSVRQAASSGELTVETVPIALEYIDEFVAQSELYPLTEPVPEADYYGGPLAS